MFWKWIKRGLDILHCLLNFGFLAIILLCAFFYTLIHCGEESPRLFSQKKLSPDKVFYVVEHPCYGLCSSRYAYYIDKEIKGDPVRKLKKPFMDAPRSTASIEVIGDPLQKPLHVRFLYEDEIYHFSNDIPGIFLEAKTLFSQ